MKAIHPGKILLLDFITPTGISGYKLAKAIGVNQARISQIIHCKRPITVDTALRLAKFFNNEPQYWLNLQNEYDICRKSSKLRKCLEKIEVFESVI